MEQFWDPNPMNPHPAATQAGCQIILDSTHWQHNKVIKFKWRVKFLIGAGPEQTDWVEFTAPEQPITYNSALIMVDQNAAFNGLSFYNSIKAMYLGMNYETTGECSTTWTKDTFLANLAFATAVTVECHGNTYNYGGTFLEPAYQGPSHHIDSSDVLFTRFLADVPQITDAAILSCYAGIDVGMLSVFLIDGEWFNDFALGFKNSITNAQAQSFRLYYMLMQQSGYAAQYSAWTAADQIWGDNEFPSTPHGAYMANVSTFGDPAQRTHGLYGGALNSARTEWFEVLQ